jgi:uncharacterized membrane-anchored protein
MDGYSLGVGTQAFDFLQISTMFLLTMVTFFGVKEQKHFWMNYVLVLTLALQCMFIILFHSDLPVKLFAALMLISMLTVGGVVIKKGRLQERLRAGKVSRYDG